MEVGKMTQEQQGLPAADGAFWFHGSLLGRMNEHLALGGDALVVGYAVAGTAKAQLFFNQWIGNAAFTVTSNSNAGVAIDFQKDFRSVMNINAGLIQTWITDREDPVPLFNVASGNTTQLSGQFSVALHNHSRLSLNATYNKSETMPENYSYGVKYTIPVTRFGRSQLYMTASATKTSFDSVALLQFEIAGNTRNSNWLLRAGYEDHSELESGPTMAGSYGITDSNGPNNTSSLTVGAEQLSNRDKRIYTNGAITNAYGRLTGGAQVTDRANVPGNNSTYYANYNTGVVATGNGVGVGGETLADSAVLVHLNGVPNIAQFDVFIDGQAKARGVPVGSTVPLFVQPYERHEVSIRGVDAPPVEYNATSQNIVLFAGNVEDMVWNIKSQHVVFGRLVDEAGMPLRNTILKGMENPVQTDEHGYFQGEVTGQTTIRATLPDGRACYAGIGLSLLTDELVKLGNMNCQAEGGLLIPIRQPGKKTPTPVLTSMNTSE